MLFFAFSCLLSAFWLVFLVFFARFLCFFEEKRRYQADFYAFFSVFGGIIAFFICSFSSLAFDFLQSKKRQFLSEIMMKNEIYGKLFLFFHFLFFARAIFT